MATGLALIASQTLSVAASSVTFSNIPTTYTDLWLKSATRSNNSAEYDDVLIRVNGLSTSIYSYRNMLSNGSTGTAGENYSQTELNIFAFANGGTSTANVFAASDMYIGNYATTLANKAGYVLNGQESSGTTKRLNTTSFSIYTASPITQILLAPNQGQFVANSQFYLYGTIKS